MFKRWMFIAMGVVCLSGCPLDVNIGECDNARIGRDLRLGCGPGEVTVCTVCSEGDCTETRCVPLGSGRHPQSIADGGATDFGPSIDASLSDQGTL